jgi:hypothetical protein
MAKLTITSDNPEDKFDYVVSILRHLVASEGCNVEADEPQGSSYGRWLVISAVLKALEEYKEATA